ncbi:hypothetical protein BH09BAC1_BH09BAC1_18440 [soil metagenome]
MGMKATILVMSFSTIILFSCNKVVEHRCECKDADGQLISSDTQYGSEDNARDWCNQRETKLNNDHPGSVYACTLNSAL